jgi:cytochrome oxidase assembly protein ShyY1
VSSRTSDTLASIIATVVILAVFIIVLGLCGWLSMRVDWKAIEASQENIEQDRYEQAYSQCMSRETIDAERCHDIAICSTWGCDDE